MNEKDIKSQIENLEKNITPTDRIVLLIEDVKNLQDKAERLAKEHGSDNSAVLETASAITSACFALSEAFIWSVVNGRGKRLAFVGLAAAYACMYGRKLEGAKAKQFKQIEQAFNRCIEMFDEKDED